MPEIVDCHEVKRLLQEGAQLVDVLPKSVFEEKHLPAALNIPLTKLDRKSSGALDPGKPVIVYCYNHE